MSKVGIQINKMCYAALFLALGWLLPILAGQIEYFGSMLCPMHIPVMIAGFILGPTYVIFWNAKIISYKHWNGF